MLASDGEPTSRTADQDAGKKYQDSAQSDLQSCRKGRCLHVAMPDPRYDPQFDHNDQPGGSHCRPEIWDQEWERVADPAEGSHETANESPDPGMTAPSKAAVVGQGLGKAHADAGPDGCRQPDHERIPTVMCRERGGEYGRECRHRAIHQSC